MNKKIVSLFLCFSTLISIFSFANPAIYAKASGNISSTIPIEYATYIECLRKAHPNWKFEFLYTGLSWDEVIKKEDSCSSGSAFNTVAGSYPISYRSIASTSYNADTNSYTVMDGSNWYQASTELIEYYMDPRNFLTEDSIFQFEKLSYDSSTQTLSGIEKMLSGSFMDGKKIKNSEKEISYAEAYLEAAKISGVSPYHLVSKTLQEVGKNGSGSTNGNSSSYPGIYNFYNIGAYAGSNPVNNGLKWASQDIENDQYLRPWNTQYKSIVGGAKYIGKSYINKGQNTIYFEKFDVIGSYGYLHQYMSNIMAANNEGKKVYSAYKNMDMLNSSFTFVIPVFNNMPKSVSVIPVSTGSPYCWLKSLGVDGYELIPEFTFSAKTNDFSITVPDNINEVNIRYSPFNSSAKIAGISESQSESNKLSTGKVTVSTKLNIRTSPSTSSSFLTCDGNKVQLSNDTVVEYISERKESDKIWYNISFIWNGKALTGWACGINGSDRYIKWDATVISINGPVKLTQPTTKVSITVSYLDASRTYNLTINKGTSDQKSEIKFNTKYYVSDQDATISKIPDCLSQEKFIENLNPGLNVFLSLSKKQEYIGTGTVITAKSGTSEKTYETIVYGDINGDGIIDAIDLIMIQKNILGLYNPESCYKEAMNVNNDKAIDAIDLIMVQKDILNLYSIN